MRRCPASILLFLSLVVPASAQNVSTLTLSQPIRTDGAMTDGTTLFATEGWNGSNVHAVDLVTGQVTLALSGLLGPIDVAKDDQDRLYATEWGSNTISRGPIGGAGAVWATIGQKPDGLLFHSDGSLWCTLGTKNKIKTVDSAAAVTVLVNTTTTNYPLGIAEGPAGNMYVGGLNNGVIWRVSTTGVVDSIATVPSTGQFKIGHLEIAQGILFASALSEHTIYTITLGGDVNLFAGTPGVAGTADGPAAAATFTSPIGLAASPSGDTLYVTSGFVAQDAVRVIDLSNVTGAPSLSGRDAADIQLRSTGPNPFENRARLAFQLPRPASVNVDVVDVNGRRVRSLLQDRRAAGRHSVEWDGRSESGRRAAAGVYFVRLQAGEQVVSERIVLRR